MPQVGVIVPSDEGRWGSITEIQEVALTNQLLRPTVRFQYRYPVGGDTATSWDVTVTALNASLMMEQRVGECRVGGHSAAMPV